MCRLGERGPGDGIDPRPENGTDKRHVGLFQAKNRREGRIERRCGNRGAGGRRFHLKICDGAFGKRRPENVLPRKRKCVKMRCGEVGGGRNEHMEEDRPPPVRIGRALARPQKENAIPNGTRREDERMCAFERGRTDHAAQVGDLAFASLGKRGGGENRIPARPRAVEDLSQPDAHSPTSSSLPKYFLYKSTNP